MHAEFLHLIHFSLRGSHVQETAQNLHMKILLEELLSPCRARQGSLPYLQRTESCQAPICSVVSADLNTHWEKGIRNSVTQHCVGLKVPISLHLNACANFFFFFFRYLELDYQNGIKFENTEI